MGNKCSPQIRMSAEEFLAQLEKKKKEEEEEEKKPEVILHISVSIWCQTAQL